MLKVLRQFILLSALGIIVIFAGVQPVQAAPVMAMAAMDGPCCPDDCPPTPDCTPACAAMMQCQVGTIGLPGGARMMEYPAFAAHARLFGADVTAPPGITAEGLRRPPKL